jgi:hypothetical protein
VRRECAALLLQHRKPALVDRLERQLFLEPRVGGCVDRACGAQGAFTIQVRAVALEAQRPAGAETAARARPAFGGAPDGRGLQRFAQAGHKARGRWPSSSPPGKLTHSCAATCVSLSAMAPSLRGRCDRPGHSMGVRPHFEFSRTKPRISGSSGRQNPEMGSDPTRRRRPGTARAGVRPRSLTTPGGNASHGVRPRFQTPDVLHGIPAGGEEPCKVGGGDGQGSRG